MEGWKDGELWDAGMEDGRRKDGRTEGCGMEGCGMEDGGMEDGGHRAGSDSTGTAEGLRYQFPPPRNEAGGDFGDTTPVTPVHPTPGPGVLGGVSVPTGRLSLPPAPSHPPFPRDHRVGKLRHRAVQSRGPRSPRAGVPKGWVQPGGVPSAVPPHPSATPIPVPQFPAGAGLEGGGGSPKKGGEAPVCAVCGGVGVPPPGGGSGGAVVVSP